MREGKKRRERKPSAKASPKIPSDSELFRLILDSITDLVAVLDLKGRRLYNNLSYKYTLADPRKLIGTDSFTEIHPADRERIREIFRETVKTGVGQRTEYRFLRKDKQVRFIESEGNVIRDESGKPRNVVVVSRDVTERKQAERKLLLLANALTGARDCFYLTDTRNKFLFINPAFSQTYGFTDEDLRGETASILLSPDNDPDTVDSFTKASSRGREWTGLLLHRRKDGSEFPVELWSSPVTSQEGEHIGIVGIARNIAERYRKEQELRASEEKFRNLVETTNDVIWEINESNAYTYVSPQIRSLLGYRAKEVIGRTLFDFMPPEEAQRVSEVFEPIVQRRKPFYSLVNTNLHKYGHAVVLETSGVPFYDRDGHFRGYRGNNRDITERKRVENELHSLNRALLTILQCNETLIGAMDEPKLLRDICQTVVNTGGYRFAWIGFAQSDPGKKVQPVAWAGHEDGYLSAARVSWADVETGRGPTGTAIRTRKPCVAQNIPEDTRFTPWRQEAIRRGYASSIALPIVIEKKAVGSLNIYSGATDSFGQQEVQLFLELANDLAYGMQVLRARKEHDEAVEKVREQAALLDIATDAIIVRGVDGTIEFWNKGAERLYGWNAEEVVGRNIEDQVYRHPEKELRAVKQTVLDQGEWKGELEHRTKNGTPITVQSRWTLVRASGEKSKVLVVTTDITEKKLLEAQFLRAQRLEGIGTLAGGIAHDLNNVLAPILMAIEILIKKYPDEQSRRILAALESSATRGADMVQQVLTFARGVEGEKVILQPRHLLSEMEKIARETFPKTIEIRSSVPKDLWTISGDATQLHQVFLNLCVNARDAMPQGGRLVIAAENFSMDENYARMHGGNAKPGSYVTFTISDNGVGIPAENLDKIFEPFFTTKPVGQGTGLGLSTVHSIVKSHSGFINVYSEVGKGTTFRVYIPSEGKRTLPGQEQEKTVLPLGHGEMILVVDDEASIREITKETLETCGYRVTTASDGAEALACYAQQMESIDLVLTDMIMPYMDGPATIRALRKLNPRVKVIAASGLAPQATTPEGYGLGDLAFIIKPYTADKLLRIVQRELARKDE